MSCSRMNAPSGFSYITQFDHNIWGHFAGIVAIPHAGLAPIPHESGTSIRGQPCIGHSGNSHLRHALYMATLSASRHNPQIRVFYDRLRKAGKPIKVARCAAARKLLHLAWAVVTKEQAFDPSYAMPQV